MIIAVVYPKGGVGKTTIACHLAVHYARKGPCLLIDGDPQESSATWAAWRSELGDLPNPTVRRLKGNDILDVGKELVKKFPVTILDAGGRDGAGLRNTLALADHVIIPMTNSGMAASLIDDFMKLYDNAQVYKDSPTDYRILFNAIDPRASIKGLEEFIDSRSLKRFKRPIYGRMAITRAMDEGYTGLEYRPRNGDVIYDFKQFFNEVEQWTHER